MVVVGVQNPMGYLKTATLTYFGFEAYSLGIPVHANFSLSFSDNRITSIENLDNLRNCRALLDELWLWAWSRRGGSDINEVIMKILIDSRKRNYDVYFSQQVNTLLDRPLRVVTDYWVLPFPKVILGYFPDGKPIYKYCLCYVSDGRKFWFDVPFIGSMFDTSEEISDLVIDRDHYVKYVDRLVDDETFRLLSRLNSKREYVKNLFSVTRDKAELIIDLFDAKNKMSDMNGVNA